MLFPLPFLWDQGQTSLKVETGCSSVLSLKAVSCDFSWNTCYVLHICKRKVVILTQKHEGELKNRPFSLAWISAKPSFVFFFPPLKKKHSFSWGWGVGSKNESQAMRFLCWGGILVTGSRADSQSDTGRVVLASSFGRRRMTQVKSSWVDSCGV